jgi:hypothetical protein
MHGFAPEEASVEARLIVPIPEVMHSAGGISRSKLYQLIRDDELQLVKIGRRSFITQASLQAFVDRLVEDAS